MRLRYYLKYLLAPILCRVPVSGLQPERLYVYGRAIKGGVTPVHDCPEDYVWADARQGYRKFDEECGLPEKYRNGVSIIEK